ncbi:protein of unknown function [Taphrina deformans PYCC 5710]|uniref:Uncharacterized protein n=1 Tax=Taphrina deformans (strain PYCC 5710 / ATCC 11124 / CBS 356.35 / IMI 108563 / JCM 9778 / NBRC 8474) TaxID=1097556 RepID=R4X930_TAPDE|nr:protein of unknown function [Taphrina deformans PYCC 5710]|eukprot:CCG82189.2 protein of unknown function [Taphrina deformans PYCC 5710]
MHRQRPPKRHVRNEPRQLLNRALDLEELTPVPRIASRIGLDAPSIGEYLQSRATQHGTKKARPLATLRTTAARFLARNVSAVPLHVLAQIQWTQARCIWEVVEAELLDSLDVFVKFATAFPADMSACKALNVSLAELPQALSTMISRLSQNLGGLPTRGTIPWSLHLDLSHVPLESEVLLQLGRVPGLSVLKINDSNIDDNTISHWARSQSAGGFPQLSVLDIRANPLRKPELCLEKLIRFPKLRLIKCDATNSWPESASVEQKTQLNVLWQDMQRHKGAVIEMKVHLGSRADRRPLRATVEETILDVPSARDRLSSEQTQTRPDSQSDVVHSRNKKRQKKLIGSGDVWQQVLSSA